MALYRINERTALNKDPVVRRVHCSLNSAMSCRSSDTRLSFSPYSFSLSPLTPATATTAGP